jgi:hypothetical protein
LISSLAKSVHHARVLIRQRHIRVGKQMVNVPSFVVRLDSQKVSRGAFKGVICACIDSIYPLRSTSTTL